MQHFRHWPKLLILFLSLAIIALSACSTIKTIPAPPQISLCSLRMNNLVYACRCSDAKGNLSWVDIDTCSQDHIALSGADFTSLSGYITNLQQSLSAATQGSP